MQTRSRLAVASAVLAFLLAAAPGRAQTTDPLLDNPRGLLFATMPEARRAAALAAINNAGFTAKEIASILGLLQDLEMSEQRRRADIALLENDLLSAKPGEINVESRLAAINQAHQERVEKVWATITERVGAQKAAVLREIVEGPRIDQTAYVSERMKRIDELFAQYDRQMADRNRIFEEHRLAMEKYNQQLEEHKLAMERYNKQLEEHRLAMEEYNRQVAAAEEAARAAQVTPPVEQPAERAVITERSVQTRESVSRPVTRTRSHRTTPIRRARVRGLG